MNIFGNQSVDRREFGRLYSNPLKRFSEEAVNDMISLYKNYAMLDESVDINPDNINHDASESVAFITGNSRSFIEDLLVNGKDFILKNERINTFNKNYSKILEEERYNEI